VPDRHGSAASAAARSVAMPLFRRARADMIRLPAPTRAPDHPMPVPVTTIGLLLLSNVFMTFAWYGHLKFKTAPLATVVLVSWLIAFFEYCAQVPANRIGHGHFSAAELKAIQEVITLGVFAVFSVAYLGEPIRWNHLVGFALIAGGAWFVFQKW
jgi:uncharacterized protein (DUF486 family)